MQQYRIKIENVRKVKEMTFDLNIESGVKLFIGDNASGKSTLLTCIGIFIRKDKDNFFADNKTSLSSNFKGRHKEAKITYISSCGNEEEVWEKKSQWSKTSTKPIKKIKGFFELSILSGVRFEHLKNKNNFKSNMYKKFKEPNDKDNLVNTYKKTKEKLDFIIENLEYIINDKEDCKDGYFSNLNFDLLYKFDSNFKSDNLKQNNKNIKIIYYIEHNGNIIREFDFSTGEYFLLSILKIISFYITDNKECKLIVIDEFELGLSPLAQQRFLKRLKIFAKKYNILFILATHSLVAINHINPNDIYYFNNQTYSTPTYPGMINSELYQFNCYDYVVLVEDDLAEMFVNAILHNMVSIIGRKTIVIPVGGEGQVKNMLDKHNKNNIYGTAKVIPIKDGDQRDKGSNKNDFLFLPIEDVEKELVKQLIKDEMFYNEIDGNHLENLKTHKLKYNNEEKTIKESCDEYHKLSREKEKAKESKEIAKRIFGAIVSYVNDKHLNTKDITPQQYIINKIISKLQEDELFKQFKQDLSNELKKGNK
ncbi:AAA family ATPase [Campylobacter sp. RM12642]|uniref:ATP-dependent nuclease n=1 Tax=unclassified Campylobacter TaxID=2593542 RepID=UPI001D450074|nr:AAA family ATPase [Campylobacter sp. RM12642]MBZ8007552.1 AAA family ATPase [Campylobacter sp. RM9334]